MLKYNRGDTMIKIVLKDTLKKHNITGNMLAVHSHVRPNTIYDLMNSKAPSISFKTLEAIINTLKDLTGNEIDVTDVIQYKNPPL